MGVGVSNPVDASTKQEIEDLIKAILKTFTTQYVKWYAIYLCKKLKEDAMIEPSPYKLLERPENTDPIKKGWLVKEGGVRKTWKRRYFVARHDFIVDYYEKEEEANKEKGKMKGSMSLCGYRVIEDPNDGIIKRLRTMAEKMGVNIDDIPKPKEYPKLTFELHHSRRRCYFIQCENEEEFKQWVDKFKTICWRAYGLKNKEQVHEKAFHEAIRRTRWDLGRWGWWSYGGSEEQILSDMISDQIEWAVMGRIYGKITGPWAIRNTIRNQILKTLDTVIMAGVTPAWKVMSQTVETLRPQIEPKIQPLLDPIGKAEEQIIDKIKDAAMSVITPALEEHVVPHLAKIMAIIQLPMTVSYDASYKIFSKSLEKLELKADKEETKKHCFKDLDYVPRSWEMYDATRELDILYDPLWALNVIFKEIYPWSLIWRGHDQLRDTMDNAMYTFEKKLMDTEASFSEGRALIDKLKEEVLADYQFDGRLKTIKWYCEILKAIVYPPFNATIMPLCKALLEPINSAIPDAMAQFIDIEQMFDDLVNGIIDDSIEVVVSSGQKKMAE